MPVDGGYDLGAVANAADAFITHAKLGEPQRTPRAKLQTFR
jgi:hypothetical protein